MKLNSKEQKEVEIVKLNKLNTDRSFRSVNNYYSFMKFLQIGSEVFFEKENDHLIFVHTKKSMVENQVVFTNCIGYISKTKITQKIFHSESIAFIKDLEFKGDQVDVIVEILFYEIGLSITRKTIGIEMW